MSLITYAKVRGWRGFIFVPGAFAPAGPIAYDVKASLRHLRAWSQGNHIWLGCSHGSPPWTDKATSLEGAWVRARFKDHSKGAEIVLFYGDGTHSYIAVTHDEGRSFTTKTTAGSGAMGDIEAFGKGQFALLETRSASGGGYDIWSKLLNHDLSTLRDWHKTNITGIDTPSIAIREAYINRKWQLMLFYENAGAKNVVKSADCIGFA